MKFYNIIYGLLTLLSTATVSAQSAVDKMSQPYWEITEKETILWEVHKEDRLPHSGNIEMSGKRISAIIYYTIDSTRTLQLHKDIIFPQLRTYNRSDQPDWKKYRAYFRREGNVYQEPLINHNQKIIAPGPVQKIEIDGTIKIYHESASGLQITRTIYPSMEDRYLCESWEINNTTAENINLNISTPSITYAEYGYKGLYHFNTFITDGGEINVLPGKSHKIGIHYAAKITQKTNGSKDESFDNFNWKKAYQERTKYLKTIKSNLILETPNRVLNTMFAFSKIRASESIFESSMGLIHSPGGGNYYLGTWANDQVEYSGPFFPYLGYKNANIAAYNTYQKFLENIPTEGHIPYAFEMDGNFPMTHLDRGDAAMIVYGTSQYVLATGDIEIAKKLWPLIEWCADYCHKMRNEFGAVRSESDEMEGRISTGSANLSTSALYFGGLKFAIPIAQKLGKEKLAAEYQNRSADMEFTIDNYFGANIEGLETYKYFAENTHLRHWICLPLNMGINTRKDATLKALFEKLWTDNGVLVEYNKDRSAQETFWDRATLYAFRGALKAGATNLALDRLKDYSNKRLLGDHVPYAVEAYPENNMKHLSAESALYARVFIEGLFGIEPIDFDRIKIKPSLPNPWDKMSISAIEIMGTKIDLYTIRKGENLEIKAIKNDKIILDQLIENGESIELKL